MRREKTDIRYIFCVLSLLAAALSASGCAETPAACCEGDGGVGVADAGPDLGLVPVVDERFAWPSEESRATSDPWIVEHHDELEVMRPRIMVLNFVNARSDEDVLARVAGIFAAIREATRYHGYEDESARPFIEPELAYVVDLRDEAPPADWAFANSTLYPREDPVEGRWGFDYEALFSDAWAERLGVEDPDEPGRFLTLCELSERGLVHEVWLYAHLDAADASAAELITLTPRYDEQGARTDEPLDRCSGSSCLDEEDEIPPTCSRTLRIGFVSHNQGAGCFLSTLGHGVEGLASWGSKPYLGRYFRELAGFDLGTRYELPFASWYACPFGADCLEYPSTSSVRYDVGTSSGTLDPYVPACGNAHFAPNSRGHYDISNPEPVLSTCRDYRQGNGLNGADRAELVSASDWARYTEVAPGCAGPWNVWWWQSFPGLGNASVDDEGRPMKNWWPYLYY